MELYEQDHFLEELLAMRRETWDTNMNIPSSESNQIFPNSLSFDSFDQNSLPYLPNSSSYQEIPQSYQNNNYAFNEIYSSLLDEFSVPPQNVDSSSSPYNVLDHHQFLGQEDYSFSMMEDLEDPGCLLGDELQSLDLQTQCKIEPSQSPEMAVFNMGDDSSLERKNRSKNKIQGQPSKNLMAERRRRKRLNDRLSMLRSIVPKISKMDRTSILGDTIDYMKELLEKINKLQQELDLDSNMGGIFKDVKQNEVMLRNTPKFEVKRKNEDTQIEICCTGKPGLLQATMNTLEAFGLEIEQCVISCFNDFTVQASCSEEMEQRRVVSCEDIKQALFRNAGYGGRCL